MLDQWENKHELGGKGPAVQLSSTYNAAHSHWHYGLQEPQQTQAELKPRTGWCTGGFLTIISKDTTKATKKNKS